MFFFTSALKTASSALFANKSRSLLTILGIVIGITAIILVMAIGQGAQQLILGQIEGLGAATIYIDPGRTGQGISDFTEVFTDSLTKKDIEALQDPAKVRNLDGIAPLVTQVATFAYQDEAVRKSIFGTNEFVQEIFDLNVQEGIFFGDDDVRQRSSVVVLGADLKDELFGPSDAVGERIKIKDRTFRVVGVLKAGGQLSIFNLDESAFMPYTTAQQYLLGINYFNEIILRANSDAEVSQVARDVELTLRESHGIDDPEKDDFTVTTQEDAIASVSTVTGILTAFLASVAAVSLFVGGIGIMNIMLVSVAERTREIGLRKAVGATNRDILVQFLLESILLTIVGGVVGIILGALLALIATVALQQLVTAEWQFTFPLSAAFLGLGVAALVGIVFGLYPARKASRKSPIEALRYQ